MRMYFAVIAAVALLATGGCERRSDAAVAQNCTRTQTDIEGLYSYRVVSYNCPFRDEAGAQLQHELETMQEGYEFLNNSEIRGVHRIVFKRGDTYRPTFERTPAH